MRASRWVALGVILALAIPVSAEAGRKKQRIARTETLEYSGGSGVFLPTLSVASCINGSGCYSLAPRKREDYLLVEAVDASGTPVPFQLSYNDANQEFCGTTGQPVWLNDATSVDVLIGAAHLPDCGGTATSGTLNVTYSNLP